VPSTWTDRVAVTGRLNPGHELAEWSPLSAMATTGLVDWTAGVRGLTDWYRDGTLAE